MNCTIHSVPAGTACFMTRRASSGHNGRRGTAIVGIDACRSIEQARCQKAPSCPTLGITTAQGVEECAQFARDRCLHGTAVADPGPAAIDACVKAIASDTTCSVVTTPETAPACSFLLGSAPGQDASADAAAE